MILLPDRNHLTRRNKLFLPEIPYDYYQSQEGHHHVAFDCDLGTGNVA